MEKRTKALKGRHIVVAPFQGVVLFGCITQDGARSSPALGWLVAGPLALNLRAAKRDFQTRFGGDIDLPSEEEKRARALTSAATMDAHVTDFMRVVHAKLFRFSR
jgi:hypothetical protein